MERIRKLGRDQGGAILVIGVFMAAFLVGVLWYIIGLGDAAIYREYMQDGADATTFAAAVYQARGMNIIALLNLIMAAVLAVLVALKVAQVLLTIATAIVCLVSLFTGCGPMFEAEVALQNLISKVEKIVDAVLPALYVTESAVAVGMPWIAEAKSVMVARDYAPTVKGGFMVGISLIPGHLTKFLGSLGDKEEEAGEEEKEPKIIEGKIICTGSEKFPGEWVSGCNCRSGNIKGTGVHGGCCKDHGGIKKTASGEKACTPDKEVKDPEEDEADDDPESENKNAGVRWGLPVEDDEFDVLCQKAAEDVVKVVFLPFTAFGIGGTVEKYTKHLATGLVDMFQEYFCGDGGIDLQGGFDSLAKAACENAGPGTQQEIDQHNQGAGDDKKVEDFDKDKCLEKFKSTSKGMNLPGGSSVKKKVPKKVYEQATAGDKYFASWSFVWGDLTSQSHADKGVDIAAWSEAKTGAPIFLSKYHFARSEFYYEPREEGRTWGDLKEEAMWNMRWRARLRRTYMPSYKLASVFTKQIDKLKEAVGSAALVDDVLGLLGDPVKQIESIDNSIGEQVGNLNEGIIH